MMFRAWAGLLMFAMLSIGCRSNNEQYDLMQRELRLQEDRIYQLEGYIEQYQAMLDEHENEPELLGQPDADPLPARKSPSIRRSPAATPRATPEITPDTLAPPNIDLGEPDSTVPSLRKPVTEDLLPDDPLPSLPSFDGARSPSWGRRRLSERPAFKSAARPMQRLLERAEALPIWQPTRPANESKSNVGSGEAPRWDGGAREPAAEPAVEATRTAESPGSGTQQPAQGAAKTAESSARPATNAPVKQAGRPLWRPQR